MSALEMGSELPTVAVRYRDHRYTLIDGIRRFEAHWRVGRSEIAVAIMNKES